MERIENLTRLSKTKRGGRGKHSAAKLKKELKKGGKRTTGERMKRKYKEMG